MHEKFPDNLFAKENTHLMQRCFKNKTILTALCQGLAQDKKSEAKQERQSVFNQLGFLAKYECLKDDAKDPVDNAKKEEGDVTQNSPDLLVAPNGTSQSNIEESEEEEPPEEIAFNNPPSMGFFDPTVFNSAPVKQKSKESTKKDISRCEQKTASATHSAPVEQKSKARTSKPITNFGGLLDAPTKEEISRGILWC